MSPRTRVLIAGALSLLPSLPARADELRKEGLDLPINAGTLGLEDEAEPPEVVVFFGQQYEGDGVFFCLDKSGSMIDGELDILKREVRRAISEFSRKMRFGIVFFDSGVQRFPENTVPSKADASAKARAFAFLDRVEVGFATCPRRGILEALKLANQSDAGRNMLIVYSDGNIACPGADPVAYQEDTLTQVQKQNFRRLPIHTVAVGMEIDEAFPKSLADQNNGSYTVIER